jgi:hypothetical protein
MMATSVMPSATAEESTATTVVPVVPMVVVDYNHTTMVSARCYDDSRSPSRTCHQQAHT